MRNENGRATTAVVFSIVAVMLSGGALCYILAASTPPEVQVLTPDPAVEAEMRRYSDSVLAAENAAVTAADHALDATRLQSEFMDEVAELRRRVETLEKAHWQNVQAAPVPND